MRRILARVAWRICLWRPGRGARPAAGPPPRPARSVFATATRWAVWRPSGGPVPGWGVPRRHPGMMATRGGDLLRGARMAGDLLPRATPARGQDDGFSGLPHTWSFVCDRSRLLSRSLCYRTLGLKLMADVPRPGGFRVRVEPYPPELHATTDGVGRAPIRALQGWAKARDGRYAARRESGRLQSVRSP